MAGLQRGRHLGRAVAFAAIALTAVGTIAAPARAADTAAPFVQAFQTMYSANSFRIAMTAVGSYGKSDVSQSTGDMIVVRQGKTLAFYMKLTQHQHMMGRSTTMVIEMVSTAAHTCMRQQQTGAWNCQTATGSLFTSGMTPDALRKASTQFKQVTSLGIRTLAGQACRGYRALDGTEQTTLWVGVSTQRPVELQTATVPTATGHSTPSPSTNITMTFGSWNDPTLKIPTV
jgi:hypothetical protein